MELRALQEAQRSDTKSSAGDKHETGREMVAQEIEKVQRGIGQLKMQETDLLRINACEQMDRAVFGAYVETGHGKYFLSTSVGKVDVSGTEVHCISMASPLAKALLGADQNEVRQVNGISHRILNIS